LRNQKKRIFKIVQKNDYVIVADTREQLPLFTINTKCIVKKLDFGDYSLVGHEKDFAIERKSLPDLLQTLTSGHKRFKEELKRASEAKYFAIVVDGSYTAMETKAYPNAWRSKVKGHQVTAIAHMIHMKYRIPIHWCKDRNDSKRLIRGLMRTYLRLIEKEKGAKKIGN